MKSKAVLAYLKKIGRKGGKKGGKATTAAKAKAARINGRKGGRPKRPVAACVNSN